MQTLPRHKLLHSNADLLTAVPAVSTISRMRLMQENGNSDKCFKLLCPGFDACTPGLLVLPNLLRRFAIYANNRDTKQPLKYLSVAYLYSTSAHGNMRD